MFEKTVEKPTWAIHYLKLYWEYYRKLDFRNVTGLSHFRNITGLSPSPAHDYFYRAPKKLRTKLGFRTLIIRKIEL